MELDDPTLQLRPFLDGLDRLASDLQATVVDLDLMNLSTEDLALLPCLPHPDLIQLDFELDFHMQAPWVLPFSAATWIDQLLTSLPILRTLFVHDATCLHPLVLGILAVLSTAVEAARFRR